MLLMIDSLFDMRVDVISVNFALWNDWSVIETRLKQDWDKIGLNYVFCNVAQFYDWNWYIFCAIWWIVYLSDVPMTAYTAHLGGWNMFFDIFGRVWG